jgi:hypothetical protein
VMSAGLLALCIFWSIFWVLWWLLTAKVVGFEHPQVIDPAQPLTRGRIVVAALCLIAFICCVMPAPVQVISP